MKRSLGIFLCGLLLGGLVGYALHRSPKRSAANATERSATGRTVAGAKVRSESERKAEDEKILLGDIAAVPFQELYETLARQRPEEIASIAQQLNSLPPGREAQVKIKAFFTAWAHLDPNAAFAAALDFQSKENCGAAVGATIAGADANAVGALAVALNKRAGRR